MSAEEYLRKNFLKLSILHESETTKIWLVKKIVSEEKFVLKKIERINLPYAKISELNHPTLPKIFYVAENDSETYVVEEFLQGINLHEYIKLHGEFSEREVIHFAEKLCDCLEILHAHQILHRDIKPSNLFLTDGGELKLIDFDAGRIAKHGQEEDTRIIGTPGFAPPEQYGFQQTDDRADIYALGWTLKILLGFENYRGVLSSVLNKCTEFDPARRYKSVSELKRAIERRKIYLRQKKFFIGTAAAGIFSIDLLFNINSAETPNFEPPAQEILQEEKIISQEETQEIEQPQIIYYDAPQIETPPPQEKTPDKIAKLIEDYNNDPATYDVEIHKMPREIFVNQMGIKNLSEENQQEKYDEYYRNAIVQLRTTAFVESLPEDLSEQEKNQAHNEFYHNEKRQLNVKF